MKEDLGIPGLVSHKKLPQKYKVSLTSDSSWDLSLMSLFPRRERRPCLGPCMALPPQEGQSIARNQIGMGQGGSKGCLPASRMTLQC